jgi:hypothetical protein
MCRCDAHHWRRLCTGGRALVRAAQHHQAREREHCAQTLQAHAELSVSRDRSASEQASTGLTDTANHNVMVRITHADSDMIVMDVTPLIRVTGVSHDLPQMMGMHDMSSVFHYGQDVFLADGTYVVTVMIGESDTAQFRDVHVMASPTTDEHMACTEQCGARRVHGPQRAPQPSTYLSAVCRPAPSATWAGGATHRDHQPALGRRAGPVHQHLRPVRSMNATFTHSS